MKFLSLSPQGRIAVIALCVCVILAVATPRLLTLAPIFCAAALFVFSKTYHPLFSFSLSSCPRSLCVWALIFPVLMMTSSLWAYDGAAALERGFKTLPILASLPFVVAGLLGLNDQARARLRYFFPVAVLAAAAYAALDVWTGGLFYKVLRGMDPGAPLNLSNLNRGIVALTLFALLALGLLRIEKRWGMMATLAVLTACAVFACQSQSAQLGFIIGLAAIFIFPAGMRAPWIAAGALIAGGIMGAPWIVDFAYDHFLNAPALLAVREAYMPERIEIWHFIAQRALENPLLGFGADSTRLMTFDTARVFVSGDTAMHPHNFAIQLWIEFGAVGALLGTVCLLAVLRGIFNIKTQTARKAALGPFLGVLSIAATSYGLWQGWFLGLLVLMFALTAVLVNKPDDNHAI